jgi:hypothetical protein
MCVDESSAKFKAKRVKFWLTYISNIINKILDVLTNELSKHLPPSRSVDHKIEVVPRLAPLFK